MMLDIIAKSNRFPTNMSYPSRWALIVANIFINAGCKVYLFKDTFPTPMVAFGVRLFKTALGVMITASHNPKDDNGYKVSIAFLT